jgi:flagellar brake protein
MNIVHQQNAEELQPYQVVSRREIILLLNGIQNARQLLKMIFNRAGDAIVTTILNIDQENGWVIIDCAQNEEQNQKIAECDNLSFDTALQKVRILFFADHLERCTYEDKPAFRIPIPKNLIRLQRREIYRVRVPRSPVVIPLHDQNPEMMEVTASLQDLSMGGVGILDESLALDDTLGRVYENCRITLTDKSVIITKLEVRNSLEISLANGKLVRRIGCQFLDLPNNTKMSLQRLITKIEREQNAKSISVS